jgi:NADH:ubiquinone oxidoreductase subunit 6 (subunit J)
MHFFLFLIFSNLAIFFGLVLIFFQNPLYSILSFVCTVLFSVLILFMYGFEFMSFIYLVVYIGAIAILFLFIIMMLNLNSVNISPTYSATVSFFFNLCVFFKTLSLVFLVNKNLFLSYLDFLQGGLTTSCADGSNTFIRNIPCYLFKKTPSDSLADYLILALDPTSELSNFCLLYDVYILHFILAGFILLFSMLGSISLCLAR